MALNWINPEDFSFNCFLMMERFQIRMICDGALRGEEQNNSLGVALTYNPAVKWYFAHKCPERAKAVEEITANIPMELDAAEVRKAEINVILSAEDFVIYTRPEIMDTSCDFIRDWDKERLFEMADFSGKTVLDVGSGSGRLAFAAAERAKHVYASEPVDSLREFLRDKITREGIGNMSALDGMADKLPYPDNTFDIVMSGHVVGDDYEAEIAELMRVTKNGGWILDCPGDDDWKRQPDTEMSKRGFEEFYHISKTGGDVYRYRKQIFK